LSSNFTSHHDRVEDNKNHGSENIRVQVAGRKDIFFAPNCPIQAELSLTNIPIPFIF